MKDFTFYDIYYTAITTLSDEEAGKFIKRICAYTVFETEDIPSKDDDANRHLGNHFPHLGSGNTVRTSRKNSLLSQSKDATFYISKCLCTYVAESNRQQKGGKTYQSYLWIYV